MNAPTNDFRKINQLIELAIDGLISPEQSRQLNDYIIHDPVIRRHYCEFIHMTVGIERLSAKIPTADLHENNAVFDQALWNELAEAEKTSPVLEIHQKEPRHELIQKVVYKKVQPKINKFSLYFLTLSTAALFCIVIFLKFAPDKSACVEVARMSDSMGAKWADASVLLNPGDLILSSNVLSLSNGLVNIQTTCGVDLTIEGPAEFEFTKEANLSLNHGRIYARVAPEGAGFSVYTANCKIVDLGTEFGIHEATDGRTELHVMKGKTKLIFGSPSLPKQNQTVLEKQAMQISAGGAKVSEIPIRQEAFVRTFHSESKTIWRGQTCIDLADIVSGGDGSGTSRETFAIQPNTGRVVKEVYPKSYTDIEGRVGDFAYHPVLELPFVDGVFVPNGPVQITSTGLMFKDCPTTLNVWWIEIHNSSRVINKSPSIRLNTIQWDGITYNNPSHPALILHANAGITFDLNAVRTAMDGVKISRFKSLCGKLDRDKDLMELWVLVDGQIRYHRPPVNPRSAPEPLDISISENDRFLTLIATDGNEAVLAGGNYSTGFDWGVFAEPRLILENN